MRLTFFAGFLAFLTSLNALADGSARWLRPSHPGGPLQATFAPYALSSVAGRLVFVATDAANGTEMWTSDGTPERTHLLVDAYPGPDLLANGGVRNDPRLNPCPGPGMKTNGVLVFASSDPGPGNLWRTDGTTEGTFPLFEPLDPDAPHLESPPSLPSYVVTSVGGPAFFVATNAKGRALWRSDGTRRGTFALVDLPTAAGVGPELTPIPGGAVFQRATGDGGFALWRSDGTAAGTESVAFLEAASKILASDDRTAFVFDFATLWSVNLVSGVRTPLKAIQGWSISAWTMAGSSLVLALGSAGQDDGLWASDGTTDGTKRIADAQPWTFVSRGADALAAGYDAAGIVLWRTDGTAAGTVAIRRFPSTYPADGSSFLTLTALGEKVWFSVIQKGNPGIPQIWMTDGTDAGTLLVTTATTGRNFVQHGGRTYYFGRDGQLWVADGPGTDAQRVASVGSPSPSTHVRLLAVDGRTAYFADDRTQGSELWKTDGTPTGTALVRSFGYDIGSAATLGGTLIFVARDDGWTTALWRYDGSEVRFLAALPLASWTGNVSGFARLLNVLYVVEAGSAGALSVWRTDGSAGGTYAVEQFPAVNGATSVSRPGIARAGSRLVFAVADPPRSTFRVLATPGARSKAQTIGALEWGSFEPRSSGDSLYYLDPPEPSPDTFGPETRRLWRSDGTPGGTYVLASGDIHDVIEDCQGGAFFARTQDGVVTLWRTDGTATATAAWLPPGAPPIAPVAVSAGRVYYVGAEVETGEEIWSADAQAREAFLLKDIGPGGLSFDGPYRSIAALRGGLVFAASDGTHGRELWVTDGTSDGTRLMEDLAPGPGSSNPGDFVEACGGLVYFTADVEGVGREPFAIPLSAINPDARPKPCPVTPAPTQSPSVRHVRP